MGVTHMRKHVHISATLDKNLFKKVDAFCKNGERSKSWLIGKAVENFLEEMEDIEIAYQRMMDPKERTISSQEMKKRLGL